MIYQAQIITQTLLVETAPAVPSDVGAVVYVNLPKSMNVFRISIWNDDDITGAVPVSTAGVATSNSLDVRNFHLIPLLKASDFAVPFVMESRNGYIVDGFYLACLSTTIGDSCNIHILFEGEQ